MKVRLPARAAIEKLAGDALREDIGGGDLTAELTPQDARARARLFCRERAVLCGAAWFDEAFRQTDRDVEIAWHFEDGAQLCGGEEPVCEIHGRARALLAAERTAINLLQTLSGTATIARRYVEAAGGRARIMDTRKTIPGLRLAQKYAAAVGGAHNHRMGLFDQVLLKENHIAAAGSLEEAVRRARAAAPDGFVEVEVENLKQLQRALQAGAQRVLLDNFSSDQLREAAELARGRAELEASGGITLEQVPEIAATGVDFISIGALTKHLAAVDFSLRFDGA